jgi:hypothetical protein
MVGRLLGASGGIDKHPDSGLEKGPASCGCLVDASNLMLDLGFRRELDVGALDGLRAPVSERAMHNAQEMVFGALLRTSELVSSEGVLRPSPIDHGDTALLCHFHSSPGLALQGQRKWKS